MTAADPVATYKEFLREIVNRRPSGIRRKLAAAFCTHPSFISQVTNPGLRVPFPAHHITELFRVCHCTPEEQERFLALYMRAHPGASPLSKESERHKGQAVRVSLPGISDPALRTELESVMREFARRVVSIANRMPVNEEERS